MLAYRAGGDNDSDCGSARSDSAAYCLRWNIPVSSARGDKKAARRDQQETAVIALTYHAAINLTVISGLGIRQAETLKLGQLNQWATDCTA
jgi:hypothetical protein